MNAIHNVTPSMDSGIRLMDCPETSDDPRNPQWVEQLPVWPTLSAELGIPGRPLLGGPFPNHDWPAGSVAPSCLNRVRDILANAQLPETVQNASECLAVDLPIWLTLMLGEWPSDTASYNRSALIAINEDGTRGTIVRRFGGEV